MWRVSVAEGMTPLQHASRIRNNKLGKAIEQVRERVSLRRLTTLRQETGYSAPALLEKLAHLRQAEIARQTGLSHATVKKYRDRWGL